jgi:hypothetical protein
VNGRVVSVDRERAHATLHALSQPLTVMSLALTVVQSSVDEVERAQALEAVMTECQRAMRSVYQLRALLEEGMQAQGVETMTTAGQASADYMVGGLG